MNKLKEIEQLYKLYHHFKNRCVICGDQATQRAHLLSNSKEAIRAFGSKIIDSIYNWRPVCSLACNQVCSVNHKADPLKAKFVKEQIEQKKFVDILELNADKVRK